MSRAPATGFIYVIATEPGEAGSARGRDIARRLAALAVPRGEAAPRLKERELPGTVWGFAPAEADAEPRGDILTHAARGRLEAVLRGDPVWVEPWSSRPVDAAEALRRWEEEGAGTAASLDNLYLLVVADLEAGEVTLVTDRMGGIPLYAADVGGSRVFCSSYIALSRLVETRDIDGDSLAVFFHLGYFPGRRTALSAVEVHPFGCVTRIRGGAIHVGPPWRPDLHLDASRPAAEILTEGVEAFNATVREYSAGRERMLLAMTAGLDSRSVAASLLKQRIPFETYTHGFPGCWEGQRVESIVKRHGIPHRFVPLTDEFTKRLESLALESFRATEGTISSIEKSHLIYVLSQLAGDAGTRAGLLLGGGAGMIKGTFYRLLEDEEAPTPAGIDRYITWNFSKRLPAIFAPEVPAADPRPLREFVATTLGEVEGGTFFQRLDYLYLVRYRRWAGGVKHIYRSFFPVREPFVSRRLTDYLFRLPPSMKKAQLPHFEILSRNYPAIQRDFTNRMTPALPFNGRTWPRFLPSAGWRMKQLIRGFSRRYLPREIFPLVDYVDYKAWIRGESGRALLEEMLAPSRMRSAFLYEEDALGAWLVEQRNANWPAFSLLDKMCTLELYFREVLRP
ncbi:MAG TPA: asparagine synthase-related protein [Planctomycetota bacterium]|nr:asparagine synthase-related protein [Planctomycetota bacterium]